MRLTKKKAISLSIELWEWLAESGNASKGRWSEWGKYGDVSCDCFLCEYTKQKEDGDCDNCPYTLKFDLCCVGKFKEFSKWDDAKTPETRKKYAKLFLTQLREL